MPKRPSDPSARSYEAIIKKIPDVLSARVVTDRDGEISEIHVLARAGRSPRQLVRDLESAILTQFGRRIDHKKVSVAQVQDGSQSAVLPPRLGLESVEFRSRGPRAEARVVLRCNGDLVDGAASGPGATSMRLRVVADATLFAVERHFQPRACLAVNDVEVVRLGSREAVIVSVSFVDEGGEKMFLGSSFLKHDVREAVARATLDAVKERIEFLTGE